MNKRRAAVVALLSLRLTVGAQVVLTDTLSEVTVTETRHEHALRSTAPMHVIDRRDMTVMGITDMSDALHRLPGITLRDYGGAGGMKTVSVRGFGTKHTGVSYDGVMLSECQSGEIDLSRYALDNVAHLSLIVGDGSDIFIPARNATTPATVNIETLQLRSPSVDTGNSAVSGDSRPAAAITAQLKAGSFGYVSPFVKYEQQIGSRLALSALGEYTYAENDYPYTIQNGIETIHDRRNNSRMNSGHGELNILWQAGRSSRLSGKLYYYDNDRQLPGRVFYYSNTSRETLRDRNAFAQMAFHQQWGDRVALKWLAKYNWAASLYDDGLAASQVNDANYWQREAYTALCLLYTPHADWAFDYSADYALNNLNSTLPTDTRPYRHTVLQSATAKYQSERLTATARLLHSLYLNGARDGEGADDMRRLSPSLSLSLAVAEGLRLRASYKDIFRAPTFNENYYFHYGATDLKPERTMQLNIGTTYAASLLHTEFTATADFYYNKVKDMILAVPFNMFVWRCINVSKVEVVGLDATLRAARHIGLDHTLTVAANYSLQRARNRTSSASPYYNNQIAYMPLHSGAASIGWENPWVNLSLSGHGVGERWTNNEHLDGTRIEGYIEMGATAWRSFRLGKSTVEVRADVRNLLDKQYEIVGSYPMPGRSWMVTVKFKN